MSDRRPMTDEEFDRLLAARVRAAKAEANSPEAVKKRQLEAARKRTETMRNALTGAATQPGMGNIAPGASALAALAPIELMDRQTLDSVGRGGGERLNQAGVALGNFRRGVSEAAGNVAADIGFVGPSMARAVRSSAAPAEAGPTMPFMPNISPEQLAAAVRGAPSAIGNAARSAPGVAAEVARVAPGVAGNIAMEMTGAPGLGRMREQWRRAQEQAYTGTDVGAFDATMRGVGEGAASAGAMLGAGALGAGAAKAASKAALPDTNALALGLQRYAELNQSGFRAPIMQTATGLTAAGAALTAGDADAMTRQDVEDKYVNVNGVAPARPDDGRALNAGFWQGLSLDNADDIQRGTPQQRAEIVRLRELANLGRLSATDAARLMELERAYDPIAWEAQASPEQFAQGRLAGEAATGSGLAVISGLAGLALRRPVSANLIAGAAKGAGYGYGAGTGEVDGEQRAQNAVIGAGVNAAISSGLPLAAKKAAAEFDDLPIRLQQIRNWRDTMEFNPAVKPARETTARLTAPRVSTLRPDLSPAEAVAIARAADAARKQPRFPMLANPPIEPRLRNMVLDNPEGAAAARAAGVGATARTVSKSKKQGSRATLVGDEPAIEASAFAPGSDLRGFNALAPARKAEIKALLRERLQTGNVSPEEQRFLATADGQMRLRDLGLATPTKTPALSAPPIERAPDPPRSLRDKVIPRLDDQSARGLGAVIGDPDVSAPPRVASDPLSPQNATLQRMLTTSKQLGPRPPSANTQDIKWGDEALKAASLAGSIPLTGLALDMAGLSPTADQFSPTGADEGVRGRLSATEIAAQQKSAALAMQAARNDALARLQSEASAAEARAISIRQALAVSPTLVVQRPDGSSATVRNPRFNAAQAALREMGLDRDAARGEMRRLQSEAARLREQSTIQAAVAAAEADARARLEMLRREEAALRGR